MKVYVLEKEFDRHSAVIGVYKNEEKAWDYVELQVKIFGEQEYNYYIVSKVELIK